jgi:hypothetical protein
MPLSSPSAAPATKGAKPAKGDTPCGEPAPMQPAFDASKLTMDGKPLKNGSCPTKES